MYCLYQLDFDKDNISGLYIFCDIIWKHKNINQIVNKAFQ